MELIRDDINGNIQFKIDNTLIVFIELNEQIYEVINIFDKINTEFFLLFLFVIKKTCKIIDKKIIYENIKDYILKNNIYFYYILI